MRNSIGVALLAAIVIGRFACASAAELQPNVTVLSDEIVYDVNADGTFSMDEVALFRVNTDQGVKGRSQVPLGYSSSLQDLEVIEAYTITKGQKRIDVTADKILLQQSPQSSGAPMFDDGKVKTVIFPGVEIGSTLSLHIRKTQKTPLFPGQFSIVEIASSGDAYVSERVTVRAPAELKLYVDAVDMRGGRIETDLPGKQVWRWSIEKVPAHTVELGSVGSTDYSPRVAVTTFPTFAAAGSAYIDRARAKAAVTPAIQKLADDITSGIADRRTQAEALYRWVSANIRYVAIFLDFGGVVPHDAQAIMEAKYGDCKDHTTILEALLAARGIQSSPVLVNASTTYWLPKVAVSPGVFNHAISYLPEFKLYVDSTAALAMFGTLPVTEQGKSALLVDDGSGKSAVVTLPLSNPEVDQVNVITKLVLDADGNVTGTSQVTNSGIFDWFARQIFSSLPPGIEPQVAGRILTLTGQSGTGTYKHLEPRDLAAPFGYSTEFHMPGFSHLPGPGAMVMPQGLSSFSNIAAAFDLFGPERRELPMPFFGRHVTEAIAISLPAGMKVATLPKSAKVISPFGIYESNYSIEGRTIAVRRSLDIRMSGPLVKPEDYPALRAMALGVVRDLRSQLVY